MLMSRNRLRHMQRKQQKMKNWQLWLSSYLLMQGCCGHPATKRWWHYSTWHLLVSDWQPHTAETPSISANMGTTLPAWRHSTTEGKIDKSSAVFTVFVPSSHHWGSVVKICQACTVCTCWILCGGWKKMTVLIVGGYIVGTWKPLWKSLSWAQNLYI